MNKSGLSLIERVIYAVNKYAKNYYLTGKAVLLLNDEKHTELLRHHTLEYVCIREHFAGINLKNAVNEEFFGNVSVVLVKESDNVKHYQIKRKEECVNIFVTFYDSEKDVISTYNFDDIWRYVDVGDKLIDLLSYADNQDILSLFQKGWHNVRPYSLEENYWVCCMCDAFIFAESYFRFLEHKGIDDLYCLLTLYSYVPIGLKFDSKGNSLDCAIRRMGEEELINLIHRKAHPEDIEYMVKLLEKTFFNKFV